MSKSYLRGTTEWALMVALVFGAGAMAQAQNDDNSISNEGVVKIGRSDKDDVSPKLPAPGDPSVQQKEAPKYWVGLMAGDIPVEHVLRAHLDLPENTGLLVANVLGKSPAAKAGLKQHDILLKGNGQDLHEMHDLIDLVNTEGEKHGKITLEILRHNKRETVIMTPEERPANAPVSQNEAGGGAGGAFGGAGGDFGPALPEDLLQQFRGQMKQMPFEFREFGPGVIVGGGQGAANLPNGVSVNIQRENDKPPHITLKRGDETWEVDGGNPESLKKVPEDLRPFVEQMLHGGGRMRLNMREPGQGIGPQFDNGRLRERLERMEKRLEEMQKNLRGPSNPPADESNDKSN